MALEFDPIEEAAENWRSAGWGAVDAMTAATSITRAHQILTGRIDAALAPVSLNFSRFEVLALLSFTKEGRLPLGKVGDRLQVHPASVTNTVNRLEADGYVRREPHPTDRRTTFAVLTAAGRRRAERGAAALADIDFGVAGMGGRSRAATNKAIHELRSAAGDFV
ncbi:MAG: MarR family transcriptional regulator [Acidimicrobiales bacterium]|nr:MarR family transcriptional regulator [Acidimicrobiales bacterium]